MAPVTDKDAAFHIPASRIVKALGRLRKEHSDMTILQSMIFFRVAELPGITQRGMLEDMETIDSVTSRAVAVLSSAGVRVRDPKDPNKIVRETKPLRLIELREDPDDRRQKSLFLTGKGRQLMQDIMNDLGMTKR